MRVSTRWLRRPAVVWVCPPAPGGGVVLCMWVSPWGRGVAVGMRCRRGDVVSLHVGVASGMVLPWGRCRHGVSPCGRCRGDAVALHVRVAVGTRCIYICLACLLSLSFWLNVGCVCLCCTFFSGCVASPIPTHTHNYLITTSQPEF